MAVIQSGGGGFFGKLLSIAGMATGNPWLNAAGSLMNGNPAGAVAGGFEGLANSGTSGTLPGSTVATSPDQGYNSSFASLDPNGYFDEQANQPGNIITSQSIFDDIERIRKNNLALAEHNQRSGDARFTGLLDSQAIPAPAAQPDAKALPSVNPLDGANPLANPPVAFDSPFYETDPYKPTVGDIALNTMWDPRVGRSREESVYPGTVPSNPDSWVNQNFFETIMNLFK